MKPKKLFILLSNARDRNEFIKILRRNKVKI